MSEPPLGVGNTLRSNVNAHRRRHSNPLER